jgi:serine/threonine-protein kinase
MLPTVAIPARAPSFSSGVDEGRFLPGTLLGARYRIIGLVGRGGMGEVYRATDLKLGQQVALKFLAESRVYDERARRRFHHEVRIARQVSHPNVCRVYDIGEVDGELYLSMEYVDGEDLSSLLRRIGRLTADKATEIARRLCAGLAAAHDKGVLHCDLKPANVMIDGRGNVLIADFGLAGLAQQFVGAEVRSGTPAYMAPEQLAGKEVSVKSDIYSLGLVLYEMYTGKRADRARPESVPTSPSAIVQDLDPALERVILRCLQADPRQRPASAVAVAAALPGGDPLAEALAAGETPSPQMVAAAGDTKGISVKTAVLALGAVLVGLVAVAVLGSKTNILQQTPFDRSPAALEERARNLIESFGYTDAPVDRAYGFSYDMEFKRYGEEQRDHAMYRALLAKGSPAVIRFWYRQSPHYLEDPAEQNLISLATPPPILSGMVSVNLNPQGRLLELAAVPAQVEKGSEATAGASMTYNWAALFTAAGLDMTRFTPVEPEWLPLVSFDARAAWTGVYPDTQLPLRIEGACWRGRPVNFQMIGPWTKPARMQSVNRTFVQIFIGSLLILHGLAVLLARRHFRLKRGDLQGAFRLAVYMFSTIMMAWLCAANHVPSLAEILGVAYALGWALFWAGFFWTYYVALEPYVRRRWPQSMIAWSRLLGGGVRDPVMGGDLLIGVACGVGQAAFFLGTALILEIRWGPLRIGPGTVTSARQAASQMFDCVREGDWTDLDIFF